MVNFELAPTKEPNEQISLTDPDARSMATSGRGSGMVAYNVQVAVVSFRLASTRKRLIQPISEQCPIGQPGQWILLGHLLEHRLGSLVFFDLVSLTADASMMVNGKPPFDVLDIGCGPGLDLRTFKMLGHRAVGLERAPSAAAHARSHSGCEVLEQSLLQLDLPSQPYDGVFANAVLFHLPS